MVQRTRKVEINLGYRCNARCPFCYYYDSVVTRTDEATLTTDQARQQLELARHLGIREIELTGGEATLRPDLPELIRYAKRDLGFEVVALITNGIRLARPAYARTLAEAGLDDVLFSVHGPDPATHDGITGVRNSFARILQGIHNVAALGLRLRTNTVVCQANYRRLTETLCLLVDLGTIDNINFVLFNPVQQARHAELAGAVYVSYRDAGEAIVRAIRACEDRLPHFNVRYLPFCFLPGYERYVTDLDQMTFDPDEWDNYASFRIRKGRLLSWLCTAIGFLALPHPASTVRRHGWRTACTAALSRFYVWKDRVKTPACRVCAYRDVCDYLYREYVETFGSGEPAAVAGSKVTDPAWCMDAARARRPGELPDWRPRRIPLTSLTAAQSAAGRPSS